MPACHPHASPSSGSSAPRGAKVEEQQQALQTRRVRKMLPSGDLRPAAPGLAWVDPALVCQSCTLAPTGQWPAGPRAVSPLANRLGDLQTKWELEDLAFRFLEPRDHKQRARPSTRRAAGAVSSCIEAARLAVQTDLKAQGLEVEVQAVPNTLFSIHKKMLGKRAWSCPASLTRAHCA